MYTNQTAFNKIVKHLLLQGRPSKVDGKCVCINTNGLMCPMGVLTHDYKIEIKSENPHADVCDSTSLLGLDTDLLNACQDVHDNTAPEHWKAALENIANLFNLKFPENVHES